MLEPRLVLKTKKAKEGLVWKGMEEAVNTTQDPTHPAKFPSFQSSPVLNDVWISQGEMAGLYRKTLSQIKQTNNKL